MWLNDIFENSNIKKLIKQSSCDADMSPEDDFKIYKYLIKTKDKQHALFHLSRCIEVNPLNKNYLDELEKLYVKHPNILEYFDLDNNIFYGMLALYSYFLYKNKQYIKSFDYILKVISIKADSLYSKWLENWLDSVDNFEKMNTENLSNFILNLINYYDEKIEQNKKENVLYNKSVEFVLKIEMQNELLASVDTLISFMLRRINLEKSLQFALKSYEKEKNYDSTISIAIAYKYLEKIDDAIEWYQKAADLDKYNNTCLLDIGDLSCERGDIEKAVYAYGKALEINSADEWALPSYYGVKYFFDKDISYYEELKIYVENNKDNKRANDVMHWIESSRKNNKIVYFDFIPDPHESIINLLKDIYDSSEGDSSKFDDDFKVTLSNFEAPSAIMCVKLFLANDKNYGLDPNLKIIVTDPEIPDGRKKYKESGYEYWNYVEFDPVQSLKIPNEKVAKDIYNLALTHYNIHNWFEEAKIIAKNNKTITYLDILSACTYIPKKPDNFFIWEWVTRYQYAAIFVLANMENSENFLKNIIYGQEDWLINCAVVALTKMTLNNKSIYPKVALCFVELLERYIKKKDSNILYCLATNWMMLEPDDRVKEILFKVLENIKNINNEI